jgi:ketosteroid isomerase-like protein
MPSRNVNRLREVYHAFQHGQLERIPEFFAPEGYYRASGVFVGMDAEYRGHARIEELWHASTEAWETLTIEAWRTAEYGDCVVAEAHMEGIGAESGLEVSFEAGHLVRFSDGLIAEFQAFPSWEQALEAAERLSTV